MRSRRALFAIACVLLHAAQAPAQSVITQADALSIDISGERGEIAFDLLGDIWTVRDGGGVARPLVETPFEAARPRWSPDSRRLLFQATEPDGGSVYLYDLDSDERQRITPDDVVDLQPVWHPGGERIAFSSRAGNGDFDIWEADLATRLRWRIVKGQGDDLEPAWSADGRDLAWIRRRHDRWYLMLRRFGQPAEILLDSADELRAPSWRPDGTLVTFFRGMGDHLSLQMIILSDPPLQRTLIDETDLYPAPVAWRDRSTLFYSAEKRIKRRKFDDWNSRIVSFRASLETPDIRPAFNVEDRELPLTTPGGGPLVIRTGRIFDGHARNYREAADVLVENGVIAEVTATRDWGDTPIIDLSSTTMLPGLIDLHADLPVGVDGHIDDLTGAAYLSWGVTTIVARTPEDFDPDRWESEATPGPRVLPAATLAEAPKAGDDGKVIERPFLVIDTGSSTDDDAAAIEAWQHSGVPVLAAGWRRAARLNPALFPLGETVSPPSAGDIAARRRSFGRLTLDLTTHQLVSALADSRTEGLDALLGARQALGAMRRPRRVSRAPLVDDLRRVRAPIAVASAANGQAPGLATHAELLALGAAQLPNDQALKAAGRQAAAMIGLAGTLGEISVGARADLILVSGDPLHDLQDVRNIVAVVRNGRFLSLVSLLERRQSVD